MNNRKALAIMFFIFFIFGIMSASQYQMSNQENQKQKEIENYLRTAKIVSTKISPEGGRTAPWQINLDDGKYQRNGFFKYIDRTRPTHLPDSYKYEIAAYELNKLLGLNIVPPVVEREIEGIKGSLQLFLKGYNKESDRKRRNIEPSDPKSFQNALEEINVFEILSYDECKDADDTLVHMEDWKLWRVDFSEAFYPSPELKPGCEITCCSKTLYQNLLKLKNNVIKAKLKPYLNTEEINALLKRKKIILKKIKQLIDEKGEESVLFF